MDGNYSYFFPLTPDMAEAQIELVVLALRGADVDDVRAEVWPTAYPPPYSTRTLSLTTTERIE